MYSDFELVSNWHSVGSPAWCISLLTRWASAARLPVAPPTTNRPEHRPRPTGRDQVNVDRSDLVGFGADQKGRHNGWELADRLVLRQTVCSSHDVLRHPLREALFTGSMCT